MSWWRRKRKEVRDRHREFIYLDEVSVVSLLASLHGEIKQSVTDKLTQTEESALTSSVSGGPKGALSLQSKVGSTRTSAREVVRRAVIQSNFRDLWRSDVGVLLHDAKSNGRTRKCQISTLPEFKRELKSLRKGKLAVELTGIKRGSILEMNIRLETYRLFKIITVATNLLGLVDGKEELFGSLGKEMDKASPVIDVLKELSVGLVPVRGISTSHCVIEVDGKSLVVATDVLAPGGELFASARGLELVGFTEEVSYWRDLRRTLFSGSAYSAYVRVEKGFTAQPWSPIKLADLFEEAVPGMGNALISSLHELEAGNPAHPDLPENASLTDTDRLRGFAEDLARELAVTPDPEAIENGIEAAASALSGAVSVTERRRAYDLLVDIIVSDGADRELVRRVRATWIDRVAPAQVAEQGKAAVAADSPPPVQLEVGFVALYW
jgi:hypothetical protein